MAGSDGGRWKFLLEVGRGAHSPLATRLLRYIFTVYFSVALLVTCLQLALEYRNEREKLHSEIGASVQLVQPVLSKTLWDFDKAGTVAILEGMKRNRLLVGVHLAGEIPVHLGRGEGGADGPSDDTLPSRLYEQRFAIARPTSEAPGQDLAVLTVYSSSTTVLHRSLGVFAAIAISALIKTLALWVILYVAIKAMVSRPLVRLAAGLNSIGTDLPGRHWRAIRPVDELSFALLSFASMRRALRNSRNALLAHQRDLERTVEERTRELQHQATHDELTGLLNRRAFEAAISSATSAPRGAVPKVLCLLDLDHFKLVNDSFGHAAGDRVLRQVADILRRNTRDGDVVARIGGDEFAIILTDCTVGDAQSKMQVLEKDVQSLAMAKDGERVVVGLSAGLVSLSSGFEDKPSDAMANADAACYAAKQGGRHQARVFTENHALQRRRSDVNWVNIINLALAEERLLLYAQPIVATGSQAVHGVEVLVRMMLDGQVIPPGHFLPAAERYGLMTKIDAWVISRTLAFLAANPAALAQLDSVHINLSAAAVCDPSFYRFLVRQIRLHSVPPSKLCFEITESTAISQLDSAVRIMTGLRSRGVHFALDDFGHGMSSFTYLQTLPVDRVKIDGSFVRGMRDNPVSCAIVTSINEIAHLAGMTTVAEFVEDEATVLKLSEIGVDYLQGYHLGRPVPIEQAVSARGG